MTIDQQLHDLQYRLGLVAEGLQALGNHALDLTRELDSIATEAAR